MSRITRRTLILIPVTLLLMAGCAKPGLYDVPQPKGEPVELQVVVGEIETTAGFIAIAVYHHADLFPHEPIDVGLAAIVDGTAVRPFRLPAGNYAVLAFQDLNSNGELDRYWFGLPKEPYTHSGKRSRFGPPGWNQASFHLPAEGLVLRLSMAEG